MLQILGITFPIFAVVGLGYILVWRQVFSQADLKVLGRYVVDVALPALIFNTVSHSEPAKVFHPAYIAPYTASALLAMAVAYFWFKLRPTDPSRKAVAAMGVSCPNSAFLGYPVLLLTMPEIASSVFAMNLVAENFVVIPFAIALLEMSRPQPGVSLLRVIRGSLLGLLKRPMIIGLLLGVAVAVAGLPIPEPVNRLMSMVAAATAALALFIIGGSLHGLPAKGNIAVALPIVIGKLIVQPAIAFGLVTLFGTLGFWVLDPDLRIALILSAAMPMFAIYIVLAQAYELEGLASFALVGATVGSFFTLTALLFVLL